jgi:hypothetical protein
MSLVDFSDELYTRVVCDAMRKTYTASAAKDHVIEPIGVGGAVCVFSRSNQCWELVSTNRVPPTCLRFVLADAGLCIRATCRNSSQVRWIVEKLTMSKLFLTAHYVGSKRASDALRESEKNAGVDGIVQHLRWAGLRAAFVCSVLV